MQVSNPNNVKIYNLSAGKSLPEWLSDRRKRTLQKQDVELRKRIELIQDFEMPAVSNCIRVTDDKQYIFATGVYKPRVRCYDVNQVSMKFERCFDAEVVKFHMLSEDYTKCIFLQSDRYVELHAQHGKYYKTRIPKNGRDMGYHTASCDLYVVGASSEVYRLNLEQGRFLNSLKTKAPEVLCCQFNPVHHLFSCGTSQGTVECWDPRVRNRVGELDCVMPSLAETDEVEVFPAVTALKYKDGLHMAVGTKTGQVLLYDLRSNKPLLVKDHQYGLPIKTIEFHPSQDLVLSCDSRILKLWDENSGKAFTSIEPEDTKINDLCIFPGTGLLFMANEAPKMLAYYIPALGPAPKWSAFLDNLTEELEETASSTVYDDYKFVSRTELESLGLAHLIGTNLLRAYMHGYFIDIRLYHKARAIAEPFAYEQYRRTKIKEKIEESRKNRSQIKKLPQVNRQLAEKLMEQEENKDVKKKKKAMPSLLQDNRFAAMFKNPDFTVDMESDEFKLINPLISKLDKERKKKQDAIQQQFDQVQDDGEGAGGEASSDEDSSDDEHTWTKEVKEAHKKLRTERRYERPDDEEFRLKPKFYELKSGVDLNTDDKSLQKKKKLHKRSLGERMEEAEDDAVLRHSGSATGSMEIAFRLKKSQNEVKRRQQAKEHHDERKKIRRSAHEITKHNRHKSHWMGKRT